MLLDPDVLVDEKQKWGYNIYIEHFSYRPGRSHLHYLYRNLDYLRGQAYEHSESSLPSFLMCIHLIHIWNQETSHEDCKVKLVELVRL